MECYKNKLSFKETSHNCIFEMIIYVTDGNRTQTYNIKPNSRIIDIKTQICVGSLFCICLCVE